MACIYALLRWLSNYHRNTEPVLQIAAFKTTNCRIQATKRVKTYDSTSFTARTEADSHADTFFAGKNCVALHFTDRTCGVQPYSDQYDVIPDVPIVTAATGYTSANGQNYIIVVPEALYMPSLDHSLFNPNQFRFFGSVVQDNPYDATPMVIQNPERTFTACLQ